MTTPATISPIAAKRNAIGTTVPQNWYGRTKFDDYPCGSTANAITA